MFRFVTIIPIEFLAFMALLLVAWIAFGLNGLIITTFMLMLLQAGRFSH